MLIITLQVDAPMGSIQGVKETLAMYLERYGDVRVTAVKEVAPEQMRFDGQPRNNQPKSNRYR